MHDAVEPVEALRAHGVDRAFVSSLQTDRTAEQLVASMIDWCRRVGKRTIAEGVEDAETLELLCSLGSDLARGGLGPRRRALPRG